MQSHHFGLHRLDRVFWSTDFRLTWYLLRTCIIFRTAFVAAAFSLRFYERYCWAGPVCFTLHEPSLVPRPICAAFAHLPYLIYPFVALKTPMYGRISRR